MPKPRPHRLFLVLFLRSCAAALFLGATVATSAVFRVEAPGVPAFPLASVGTEDNTPWFDAEEWLRGFPGVVEWDPQEGRLVYREGADWAALRDEQPFAVRNGRPVADVSGVRRGEDGLQVSERFLRTTGPILVGRQYRLVGGEPEVARRIVLDPGHGGAETGSRGEAAAAGGTGLEKDVVLEVALTAAERLRAAGYAVHLTRSGDHALGSAKRAAVANYWQGELFVSLHVAGEGRPLARGFEVFVAPEPPPDVDRRQWQAAQLGVAEESRRWAATLREALGGHLATFDRGMKVLPSPVLEAVTSPAVLVEVGNLSWAGDAELLGTEEGRMRIADAVVEAADLYFSQSQTSE